MGWNLYFDDKPVSDFSVLVASYDWHDLSSPFRSTIPLLSLLKDNRGMLQKILTDCGMAQPLDFHFEYQVGVRKGHGKSSQTDLMVRSRLKSLAIEAKWTEPMYPKIGEWLVSKGSPSQNRKKVLQGWLELLPHFGRGITSRDVTNCVYQMVHRAASACFASTRPQLAYFKFTPSPDARTASSEDYQAELERLHSKLGSPNEFPFF